MKENKSIYDFLVRENESTSLVGLIAYSFYKEEYFSWLEKFQSSNGRYPNTDERLNYKHSVITNKNKMEHYRQKANDVVGDMLDNVVRSTEDQMEQQIIQNIEQKYKRKYKKIIIIAAFAMLVMIIACIAYTYVLKIKYQL